MRRFLNAMIEVKQKFPEILPLVYRIMQENQWEEKRRLFFLEDVNDAKTESRTPHAMMCRAFPQLMSYWHPTEKSEKYEEKWYGYFSNFPEFIDGNAVFMTEKEEITRGLLESIAAKIPKPYSFFQTDIALDGISWYKDCNTTPALDWQAGKIHASAFFFHAMFYQSNSVFLEKRFDMKAALRIRIELTRENPRKKALEIVEKFQAVFGTPKQTYTKIYTISVSPWENREWLLHRTNQMQEWYNEWCRITVATLQEFAERKKQSIQIDAAAPDIKNLKKHFCQEQRLTRHEIRNWDDYGWCRRLAHNFWIYVELVAAPVEPDSFSFEHDLNNYMRIYCYGDNFHLYDHLDMRSFVKAPWNVMGNIVFNGYALYIKLFEEEVVPKLAELFGDTGEEFYQESYEMDVYWQQNLLGGWMDERRRAGKNIW